MDKGVHARDSLKEVQVAIGGVSHGLAARPVLSLAPAVIGGSAGRHYGARRPSVSPIGRAWTRSSGGGGKVNGSGGGTDLEDT